MAKFLGFFADGTWNGPDVDEDDDGSPDLTNVLKLYERLAGALEPGFTARGREQEKAARDAGGRVTQAAKYLHGVGDSDNPVIRLLGGAVGGGLIGRVIRSYTYLSRNYRPGDALFGVGFSRGAYTVRALAGMIAKVGLLDPEVVDLTDRRRGYRYGMTAWVRYRARRGQRYTRAQKDFLEKGLAVPAAGWRSDVPIRAVGVWDTVGAYGIPFYSAADGHRFETVQFADHALSPKVASAFHALSIDEKRADFTPTLWDPRAGIEQVWFAGAHADVGGGYPAAGSGLSDVALGWMAGRLASAGVAFAPGPLPPGDPTAPMHAPWDDGVWKRLPRADRRLPADPRIHASVYARAAAPGAAYAPRPLAPFTTAAGLDPRYRA